MTSNETMHTQDAGEFRRTLLWCLFIAAVVFVLYRISFSFGFVYDDHEQIVSNPALRTWAAARLAWTQHLWQSSHAVGTYYRPFFILWCYLNFLLFRTSPVGWHVMAVALHAVASCSVYVLARKLRLESWAAGVAGLLFAVHPVHVEAVSWLASSADALACLLFVFSFAAFLRTREEESGAAGWWAVSCVLAFCSVFTKEVGVTMPGVVIAYGWIYSRGKPLSERLRASVLPAIPFAAIVATYLVARSHALHGVTPQVSAQTGILRAALTLPAVLERFLEILIFPVGLNSFYFTTPVMAIGFSNFLLPVIVLVATAGLLWWLCRKNETLTFAFWWIPITLGPILYLPALPYASYVRDRYVYLPSVGLVLLVAALMQRIPLATGERPYLLRAVAAGVLIVALGAGAMLQQTYWADDLALAYRGFQLSPQNVLAEVFYAQQLRERGQYARSLAVLEHVFTQPKQETAWYYDNVFYSIALTQLQAGNFPAAREAFARAESLDPNRDTAVALERKAAFLGTMGDYPSAINLCRRVMELEPDAYEMTYNCGYTYFAAGDYSDAEPLLRHAVQVAPEMPRAHFYLGESLLHMNRVPEAQRELQTTAALSPKEADVHSALAIAYELEGNSQEAIREYRTELAFHPENKAAAGRLAQLTSQR